MFGCGRKQKTSPTMDRLIQPKLKLGRRKSARTVTFEFEISVSQQLHETGLIGRVARKKPYVNKINCLKRLKYAKEMLWKPLHF